jgi:hypothetical protein
MPEIVIKQKPIKRILYFVISIMLFLIGFILLKSYFMIGADDRGYLIEGLLGIAFIGIGLIILLTIIFKRMPRLIINKEGIIDKLSMDSLGFIPWSDMGNIQLIEVAKQSFISIKIVNFNDKMKKLSKYKQTLNRWGLDIKIIYKSDYDDIIISSMYTNYETKELLDIMEKYRQEYKKNRKSE